MFPPCYLPGRKSMVEVMKIMVTSLKRSHACTATVHALNPAVGHHQPMPETPGHQQARLGQSLVGSMLLSSGSWCTRFCCALQESISQCCVSSGSSMVGLMATSLKRTYLCHTHTQSSYPCGKPLPPHTSTGDAQTQFCLSLCEVPGSWYTQDLFEPSERLQ